MVSAEILHKTYDALARAACSGKTITYGELFAPLGVAPRSASNWLNPISAYCAYIGVVDITAIVVTKETGRPTDGHYDPDTWEELRDQVFVFPWLGYTPPSPADLVARSQ